MRTEVAVTGGAQGLGRAIAAELLARGRAVVLVDRDARLLRQACADLRAPGGAPVAGVLADLSSLDGVRTAGAALAGRPDLAGLVNNAGGWQPGTQYPEADLESWSASLTLNLLAPMLLTQLLWPALGERAGAVVNIGSSGGLGDGAYASPEYGAAKAGLHRFTSSLSGNDRVRVMAVVPGWIGLPRAVAEWAALPPEQQQAVGPLIPPEAVAREVVTLLERGAAGEVVEMLHAGSRVSTARSG